MQTFFGYGSKVLPASFFFTFSFLAKFNNRFFCLTNGSLAQNIFLKNLFEMLINLTSPKFPEVYKVILR